MNTLTDEQLAEIADKGAGRTPILPMPSVSFLHECFSYETETGKLFWRKRPLHHFGSLRYMKAFNSRFADREAGFQRKHPLHGNSYLRVCLKQGQKMNSYFVHRIILAMHGEVLPPNKEVDHIDHNRSNNRLDNLRVVTTAQNQLNRQLPEGQDAFGVCKLPNGKWRAVIGSNNGRRHIGVFSARHHAVAARRKAEKTFNIN